MKSKIEPGYRIQTIFADVLFKKPACWAIVLIAKTSQQAQTASNILKATQGAGWKYAAPCWERHNFQMCLKVSLNIFHFISSFFSFSFF